MSTNVFLIEKHEQNNTKKKIIFLWNLNVSKNNLLPKNLLPIKYDTYKILNKYIDRCKK